MLSRSTDTHKTQPPNRILPALPWQSSSNCASEQAYVHSFPVVQLTLSKMSADIDAAARSDDDDDAVVVVRNDDDSNIRPEVADLCRRIRSNDEGLTRLGLCSLPLSGQQPASPLTFEELGAVAAALRCNTSVKVLDLYGCLISSRDNGGDDDAREPTTDRRRQQRPASLVRSFVEAALVKDGNLNPRGDDLRHRHEPCGPPSLPMSVPAPSSSSLTWLSLSGNDLTDADAVLIGRALERRQQSSQLRALYLCRNRFGDDGAVAIARGLLASAATNGTQSCLEKIHLSSNRIGDRGCRALAQCLVPAGALSASSTARCCRLKELGLADNRFITSDVGHVELAKALGRNSTLLRLDLTGTGADSTACEDGDNSEETVSSSGETGIRAIEEALLYNNSTVEKLMLFRSTASCSYSSLHVGGVVDYDVDGPEKTCCSSPRHQNPGHHQKQVQDRIDRICYENRRTRCRFDKLKSSVGRLHPISLWPHALEQIQRKPDFLFEMVRAEPELYQYCFGKVRNRSKDENRPKDENRCPCKGGTGKTDCVKEMVSHKDADSLPQVGGRVSSCKLEQDLAVNDEYLEEHHLVLWRRRRRRFVQYYRDRMLLFLTQVLADVVFR